MLIVLLLTHSDSISSLTSVQNNLKHWIECEPIQTLDYFDTLLVTFNKSAVNRLKQQEDRREQSGFHEMWAETCTWHFELKAVQLESTCSTLLPHFCLHSEYYLTERNNINKTVDNRTTLSYHSQLAWKAKVEKKKEGTHEALTSFSLCLKHAFITLRST